MEDGRCPGQIEKKGLQRTLNVLVEGQVTTKKAGGPKQKQWSWRELEWDLN